MCFLCHSNKFDLSTSLVASGQAQAQASCRTVLTKMLEGVPKDTTFTETVEILPAKVIDPRLTVENEHLIFQADLRVRNPSNIFASIYPSNINYSALAHPSHWIKRSLKPDCHHVLVRWTRLSGQLHWHDEHCQSCGYFSTSILPYRSPGRLLFQPILIPCPH